MQHSYQSYPRFKSWIFSTFVLILLSAFSGPVASAEKPTAPPGNSGLKPGAIIKHKGNSTAITGGPFLTDPSKRHPREIATGFVREHKDVFGLSEEHLQQLVERKTTSSGHNGASHVYLEQVIEGHRVSGMVMTVNIDKHGRIVSAGGPVAKGKPTGVEFLTGSEAVWYAGQAAGIFIPALNPLASRGAQQRWENTFANVRFPNPVTAELVWLEISPDELRLTWETDFEIDGSRWLQSFVDAETGEVLQQHNRYLEAGPEGTVYTGQHPEDSGPRAVTPFTGINGTWVSDRFSTGNNVLAYRDLADDDDGASGNVLSTPASPDPDYQHFNFPWTNAWRTTADEESVAALDADLSAVITQLFYYTNVMHDWLYGYGFDEASGNFQVDNFGNGGSGNDPVKAEAQDGWDFGCIDDKDDDDPTNDEAIRCRNNANFATPGDGSSPRMQMYMWAPSRPYGDGSMDGDVIAHEYGHGVSNRLVGGGSLGNAMVNGSLGEGWSDIISFLKWGDTTVGEYVTGNSTRGIRRVAYDTSNQLYSDYNPNAGSPHPNGEIWATMVYDIRAELGINETAQLVIDGMKSTVASPDYMDARDGIITADALNNAGANYCMLWRVFANRGLGLNATFNPASSSSPTNNFDLPAVCVPTADAGGAYVTDEGTDVVLDASASTAGSDPSGDEIVQYEWDFDNDSQYDDATGVSPTFTMVGDNNVFAIGLRITTEAGITDEDSTTITVDNVTPQVSLQPVTASSENAAIQLDWSVSDAGWLDLLTATVDWDDGLGPQPLSGSLENVRPDATLSGLTAHTYGDNGVYTIEVCGSDDDGASACSNVDATISNVDPTAVLAEELYIAHADEDVVVEGNSTDPGSDDLTAIWDWDITDLDPAESNVLSLVNPPDPDPAKSPSIQPRDVDWSESHAYSTACLYDLAFTVSDDDGGDAEDTAVVIVTGNESTIYGSGWWMNQYRNKNPNDFETVQLVCFLKITSFLSDVFEEVNSPLTTRAHAVNVLFVKGNNGSDEELFDEQLPAVWLNFANGAFDLDTLVDTDGDDIPDTTFEDTVRAAEAVRLDGTATREELLAQKDILESLMIL